MNGFDRVFFTFVLLAITLILYKIYWLMTNFDIFIFGFIAGGILTNLVYMFLLSGKEKNGK
jgi:hypothetical protein